MGWGLLVLLITTALTPPFPPPQHLLSSTRANGVYLWDDAKCDAYIQIHPGVMPSLKLPGFFSLCFSHESHHEQGWTSLLFVVIGDRGIKKILPADALLLFVFPSHAITTIQVQ
jgi:hypothetical protein